MTPLEAFLSWTARAVFFLIVAAIAALVLWAVLHRFTHPEDYGNSSNRDLDECITHQDSKPGIDVDAAIEICGG